MQLAKQDVVAVLRRTGFPEAADEFERVLPDHVDLDELASLAQRHGITRDDLISRMGGSP